MLSIRWNGDAARVLASVIVSSFAIFAATGALVKAAEKQSVTACADQPQNSSRIMGGASLR
jgi:hypothetical protein